MLAQTATYALRGVDAIDVEVEADIHQGLPAFTIVGLPDAAVQESRERVRAAIVNSQYEFPMRRITVNLAPADLRKAGPGFDLALAAALLAASEQIDAKLLADVALCGELGLDGSVRPVRGVLAFADAARRRGRRRLVVPRANAGEARLMGDVEVVDIATLTDLLPALRGERPADEGELDIEALLGGEPPLGLDMADVRGHAGPKRALEVAAAGGHNVLMIGPPGVGKSMLARRLPGILPRMSLEEALAVTRVHSVAGLLGDRPLVDRRPFRAPHHSISSAGLVGGGPGPSPGEVTLAHFGVLFLDELSEFARPALEALRQPLEEGFVNITRSQRTASFPARFMLVAATNPCPCGHWGDRTVECACHPTAIARYSAKLSGPLLDRIDLIVHVEPPRDEGGGDVGASSLQLRAEVAAAHEHARSRLAAFGARSNAELAPQQLGRAVELDSEARRMLTGARERVGLSMRGHDRVMRVARTIADLDQQDRVEAKHVAEALAYREPAGARTGMAA